MLRIEENIGINGAVQEQLPFMKDRGDTEREKSKQVSFFTFYLHLSPFISFSAWLPNSNE
jgi:hypothetical protein